jgi:hypothetical protein
MFGRAPSSKIGSFLSGTTTLCSACSSLMAFIHTHGKQQRVGRRCLTSHLPRHQIRALLCVGRVLRLLLPHGQLHCGAHVSYRLRQVQRHLHLGTQTETRLPTGYQKFWIFWFHIWCYFARQFHFEHDSRKHGDLQVRHPDDKRGDEFVNFFHMRLFF